MRCTASTGSTSPPDSASWRRTYSQTANKRGTDHATRPTEHVLHHHPSTGHRPSCVLRAARAQAGDAAHTANLELGILRTRMTEGNPMIVETALIQIAAAQAAAAVKAGAK